MPFAMEMTTFWRESQQLVVLVVTVLKPVKTSKVSDNEGLKVNLSSLTSTVPCPMKHASQIAHIWLFAIQITSKLHILAYKKYLQQY